MLGTTSKDPVLSSLSDLGLVEKRYDVEIRRKVFELRKSAIVLDLEGNELEMRE